MLLTITNTHPPATDLGYLLQKHPDKFQSFKLSFGKAHIFFPEATTKRCTVALLLDVDPVGLVRRRKGSSGPRHPLAEYVNDRPYVASSFLSVAIARVLRSAMAGRSDERPELAVKDLPLEAEIAVIPSRGGENILHSLFEPLGYEVSTEPHMLDEQFIEWGESPYYTVRLRAKCKLQDLLTHLYVLTPVLDDDKHYWVGDDEVAKLLRQGKGWLASHPERELIAERYLKHQHWLTRQALTRLLEEDQKDPDGEEKRRAGEENAFEASIGLAELRLKATLAILKDGGYKRVLDIGCGEGRLLKVLLESKAFEEIVGVDVSVQALRTAKKRLRLDQLPPMMRNRIHLIQSSLTYKDSRLSGYDAATMTEVIEHLNPVRLPAFERSLFEYSNPRAVVITTPNSEYNPLFKGLPSGALRHRDHRFEWTRKEFQEWAEAVARRHGYAVDFLPVGPEDPKAGPPTQMGVFTR